MERGNRPAGREKRVTGNGKVYKRGDGLNLGGPVGNAGGYSDRGGSAGPGNGRSGGSGLGDSRGPGRRGPGHRGPTSVVGILAVILCLIFGYGSTMNSGQGGSGTPGSGGNTGSSLSGGAPGGSGDGGSSGDLSGGSGTGGGWIGSLLGGNTGENWFGGGSNTGVLDTSVAPGAREKRTVINGGGQDTVTVMIYMCGTDLESRSGMATSDLKEMAAATLSDRINVLVYTGGCTGWKNQVVSSRVNQIYQVKEGGLVCLEPDMGDVSMTKPETLSEFIRWCSEHYPANRRQLIFWDHGGGSVSGYGYDQKYPKSGSMTLAGIDKALEDGGTTFDFIGFDACLMATMENALMLGQYGDYMIASEETEPGYGWYYTDWLTKLSEDPSMPTLEIGRQIADDFVRFCAQKGQGSSTTLSLVDLAELECTAPEPFAAFSQSASRLIQEKEYKKVSDARSRTKEFARSSGIDQVDLVHLAENMGTQEGAKLAQVLKSAVKYNRTSSSIANAYGLSIYFPYKKVSSVDRMVRTYEQIGMDEDYSRCIQEFASLETAGQAASGGTSSPLPALLGSLSGSQASGGDTLLQILGAVMSGEYEGISGLDGSNMGFLTGRSLEDMAEYIGAHQFDAGSLTWEEDGNGGRIMRLEEEQWDLVQTLELNVFFDDGQGFIDLGLDNVFEFDDEGNLKGDYDRTWLAIEGQPVAYYVLDETRNGEEYCITGRVPAMLNGERAELILIFDQDTPYGRIAGAGMEYGEETETVAKGLTEIEDGDRIDFLCDYYGYDGSFLDNYYLGDPLIVQGEPEIGNVDVGEGQVRAAYRFTDLYHQHYWSEVMGD